MAKKKILGEEYTSDILNLVEDNIVAAMVKVFVEGIDTKKNNKDSEDLQEEEEKNGDKKYKIRVK